MNMRLQSDWPFFLEESDLAPGDRIPHPDLPESLALHRIDSVKHPLFEQAFVMLMQHFGPAREMESQDVIAMRMQWGGRVVVKNWAMLYEMQVLTCGGFIVGVRDHAAIRHVDGGPSFVHLSHALVSDEWRRRGIISILRTLPVQTARELASRMGKSEEPVVLFCEMDPLNLQEAANRIRRLSYQKAGFLRLPPTIGYLQPDFRSPELIDADPDGTQPVPLDLLFRLVGDESRTHLQQSECLGGIRAVYAMYSLSMSSREMAPCNRWLDSFAEECPAELPLYLPTEVL